MGSQRVGHDRSNLACTHMLRIEKHKAGFVCGCCFVCLFPISGRVMALWLSLYHALSTNSLSCLSLGTSSTPAPGVHRERSDTACRRASKCCWLSSLLTYSFPFASLEAFQRGDIQNKATQKPLRDDMIFIQSVSSMTCSSLQNILFSHQPGSLHGSGNNSENKLYVVLHFTDGLIQGPKR